MSVSAGAADPAFGAVGGGDPREAEVGLAMLRAGGNAIDAVVAAAFVGYVVEPASCGVGGHGRLAASFVGRDRALIVDGYAIAPARARPDMYTPVASEVNDYGWSVVEGRHNERGHLSTVVPGAVGCLLTAHTLLGRLPRQTVMAPAIDLAVAGLPVDARLQRRIAALETEIRRFPATAAWLLPGGRVPQPATADATGDRLDTTELAATLRRIADEGTAGFYGGPFADALDREMTTNGGILRADDLAAYRPRAYEEAFRTYRGSRYVTAGDPIAYEALNILETFDVAALDPDGADYRHLMAEVLGQAFTDGLTYDGDPLFVRTPRAGLTSKAFAAARAQYIRLDRAAPRPIVAADPWPFDDRDVTNAPLSRPTTATFAGTSQMAAVDRWGNMVTLCTSLGYSFGSLVTVPGTGVLLLSSMHNFDARPGHPNSIAPAKMPIFAAPVLIARDDTGPIFGVCGSGGYRITTGCLHTLVNTFDHGLDLQTAAAAPRVHCQGRETFVDDRLPLAVQDELAARGHDVVVHSQVPENHHFGRVAALHRQGDGSFGVATDPDGSSSGQASR